MTPLQDILREGYLRIPPQVDRPRLLLGELEALLRFIRHELKLTADGDRDVRNAPDAAGAIDGALEDVISAEQRVANACAAIEGAQVNGWLEAVA